MKNLRLTITVDFTPNVQDYAPDESPLEVERQNLTEMGPVEFLSMMQEDDVEASIDVVNE